MSADSWQKIRYLGIGALNVGFTLFVFWLLDRLYSATIGVQAVYWISAFLGIVNGFIWQRLLVWRSRNHWHSEFARFLALNLATAVTNSALLFLAVDIAGLFAFPSQVGITAVLVVLSYLLSRNWVFRHPTSTDPLATSTLQPSRDSVQRIDVFLQYYKPHVSGLTNMAADLAEFASQHGYDVHVHCVSTNTKVGISSLNGVTVHSYRHSFSLGRGVFSLSLISAMWGMRNRAGIAHAHMPYPESFLLAWILGPEWRLIATFQCDAPLTGGLGSLIARALDLSQSAFIRRAKFTVASSTDYAVHSRLARVMAENGGVAIPATSTDRHGGSPTFAESGKKYIGFLGRPTSEKGIDVIISALELLPDNVCLLLAGPTVGLTEKASFDREKFDRLSAAGRIRALGFLRDEQIADFYASLDVFALPSTNSFEAFGIVQVEALSAGTPVVASNLPGVRTIVQSTGFGEIFEIGDAADFARCVLKALEGKYDLRKARATLENVYLSPKPEEAYLKLYRQLQPEGQHSHDVNPQP